MSRRERSRSPSSRRDRSRSPSSKSYSHLKSERSESRERGYHSRERESREHRRHDDYDRKHPTHDERTSDRPRRSSPGHDTRNRDHDRDRDRDRSRRSPERRIKQEEGTQSSERSHERDRSGRTQRDSRRYEDTRGSDSNERRREPARTIPAAVKHEPEAETDFRRPTSREGDKREAMREAMDEMAAPEAPKKEEPKAEPNFGLSGKLTAETNTLRGVVLKYNEPPEARKCPTRWRLYEFKGDDCKVIYIHRQSAYLIGREAKVADIAMLHPSLSGQHAVLQYRAVTEEATGKQAVKPYIIDLGSTNGTFLNNDKIEPQRYYELRAKDMLKFGFSSREYVLMNEETKVPGGSSPDGSPTD